AAIFLGIHSGEALEIPFVIGIFIFSARKCEFGVGFNLRLLSYGHVSVLIMYLYRRHPFLFISTLFVIKDNVGQGRYSVFVQPGNALNVFFFRAVTSTYRSFLIKFAKVEE